MKRFAMQNSTSGTDARTCAAGSFCASKAAACAHFVWNMDTVAVTVSILICLYLVFASISVRLLTVAAVGMVLVISVLLMSSFRFAESKTRVQQKAFRT